MPAYNFKAQFAHKVETGLKRCTIRPVRKVKGANAQPGKVVQLYTGMRTKNCRKLVDPDPVVISVEPIVIHSSGLVSIAGRLLSRRETIAMARADGFDSISKFYEFFGPGTFEGLKIEW